MAFVSQDDKKELAVGIKAVLKKYKMKGSISVRHHSTLVVKLSSGNLDLLGAYKERILKKAMLEVQVNPNYISSLPGHLNRDYFDVNTYWIEDSFEGEIKEFLLELKDAMEGKNFFNNDDPMTDYFNRSHYIDIEVGTYKKAYQCTADDYTEFNVETSIEQLVEYVGAAA